jgi:hypothetical protein
MENGTGHVPGIGDAETAAAGKGIQGLQVEPADILRRSGSLTAGGNHGDLPREREQGIEFGRVGHAAGRVQAGWRFCDMTFVPPQTEYPI